MLVILIILGVALFALEWYSNYLGKIDSKWATKQWTEQELQKYSLAKTAMERIEALKADLFFEEMKE